MNLYILLTDARNNTLQYTISAEFSSFEAFETAHTIHFNSVKTLISILHDEFPKRVIIVLFSSFASSSEID